MDGPEMISIKPLSEHEYANYEKFENDVILHEEQQQRPGEKLKPFIGVN
jgi:hypothetical protein